MDNVQKKIIEAAINCIEKYGIDKVTIRIIGEEAGVNSAAISYYFRSKDNLIELAQAEALKNGFEWEDYAYSDALGAKDQLAYVLFRLAGGAMQYPNLTKSFFTNAFLNGDYSSIGIKKLNEFLDLICDKLSNKCPNRDKNDIRLLMMQAFSCAVLPIFTMPSLLSGFSGINLADIAVCRRYIESTVDRLWGE